MFDHSFRSTYPGFIVALRRPHSRSDIIASSVGGPLECAFPFSLVIMVIISDSWVVETRDLALELAIVTSDRGIADRD